MMSPSENVEFLKKHLADQINALDKSAIVAITDPKGVITYVNEMFCTLSEYSRSELIGKTHSVVNSTYHPRDFFKNMWRHIGRGEVWRGEICNRAKSGRLYWVDTTIVPFVDENGRVEQYIAIRYDITSRKQTESELDEERLRLLQSEKMASIGVLTAGIAHELGNPLGAIRGRLEMLETMLEQEVFEREFAKTSVKKMIQSVDRMSKIIRSLKSYSRDGSKDPKIDFNLSQLVGDIVEVSVEKCRKNGIQVNLIGWENPLIMRGRETELAQVVVNLFNNAFDAVKEAADARIELELRRRENDFDLVVRDSGPGVPQEVLPHIFDPFYTTKEVGKGTGLGLSICRAIVEDHGGELTYERDRGWTLFRASMPQRSAES